MTEAEWRMKKAATVELENELGGDGSRRRTGRDGGRTDGWRWRTDSGVEGDDGRTDGADGADEGLAKDGRGH